MWALGPGGLSRMIVASNLTFLCLGLLICEMGIIRVPASSDSGDNEYR